MTLILIICQQQKNIVLIMFKLVYLNQRIIENLIKVNFTSLMLEGKRNDFF